MRVAGENSGKVGAIRAVILYASLLVFPAPPPPSPVLLLLDSTDELELQSGSALNKVLLFPFNTSFGFNPVMKSTGGREGGMDQRNRGRGAWPEIKQKHR